MVGIFTELYRFTLGAFGGNGVKENRHTGGLFMIEMVIIIIPQLL